MDSICTDLEAETADLLALLEPLSADSWDLPTPAVGWSIRDQVSHLTFFDITGRLAAVDAEAFAASSRQLMTSGVGTAAGLAEGRARSTVEVLTGFVAARTSMIATFRTLDPKTRLPWYGPPMGALSFATARLMETWAHGQDIADTLGVTRAPSARLRHVAHIGVKARPFSYVINGRTSPSDEVTVRLTAPDGEVWSWNDASPALNVVEGPALDFCLLVTQRRHQDDLDLTITGDAAIEWMSFAQAFAGEPGTGRAPLG